MQVFSKCYNQTNTQFGKVSDGMLNDLVLARHGTLYQNIPSASAMISAYRDSNYTNPHPPDNQIANDRPRTCIGTTDTPLPYPGATLTTRTFILIGLLLVATIYIYSKKRAETAG